MTTHIRHHGITRRRWRTRQMGVIAGEILSSPGDSPNHSNHASTPCDRGSHIYTRGRCQSRHRHPRLSARRAVGMHRAIAHRLIDDNVTVANLDVVQAIWVGADPCLKLDRCALAPKIRQRHQVTCTTLATPWKSELHARYPFLQLRHTQRSYPGAAYGTATTLSLTGGMAIRSAVLYHMMSAVCFICPGKPNGLSCGISLKMRENSNFQASPCLGAPR